MKKKVYCKNCEYFNGPENSHLEYSCMKSRIVITEYYSPRYYKGHKEGTDMNKNNNCKYYKEKDKINV